MSAPRHNISHPRAIVSLVGACLLFSLACAQLTHAQVNAPAQADDKTRGIELYQHGDYEGAVRVLQVVVKQQKNDADAWYYLGLTYNRKNDVKQARKAFEHALKLRPQFDAAQTGIAYTLLRGHKLAEAERAANRALAMNAQNAEAYYVLGVVHLQGQKNADALSASEAALRVKPDYAPAFLLKSQALVGLFEQENEAAIKAAELGNSAPPSATTQARSARLREAAQSIERFLTLSPNHPDAPFWREQLETLRVYTAAPEGPSVYNTKEVTSRAIITSKPEPTFTQEARQNNTQGEIVLRMVLAADGKVKYILVLKGLSDGLTERAIAAARQITFIPAMKDGHPVSQFVTVSYNFNIY
ncbi:MAG: hypothetical protein DMF64_06460 [Acidobacteria bacterium]|nr:MAG: hypothetical protein DMF64_06460 [Acidobacteriota bacterium]